MSGIKTEGVIQKSLSGFYYVSAATGLITCRARGKFRHEKVKPLVGDRVSIQLLPDGSGVLETVHERYNAFARPAVANIHQMVLVASAATPVTDPGLLDHMTAFYESYGCEVIICLNKWDMTPATDLLHIYEKAGFLCIPMSAVTGLGMKTLREALRGKTSAFSGNSGVGKSSILNQLCPALGLPTGDVSEKLGRGRHTTRHVELFPLEDGGFLADTPGFAAFDAEQMDVLPQCAVDLSFREFAPFLGQCRFLDCQHVREPDCAVRDAVAVDEIGRSRYESYLRLQGSVAAKQAGRYPGGKKG